VLKLRTLAFLALLASSGLWLSTTATAYPVIYCNEPPGIGVVVFDPDASCDTMCIWACSECYGERQYDITWEGNCWCKCSVRIE